MKLIRRTFSIYMDPRYRIPLASAGLSYYLTMTIFPTIILIYFLLGNNYDAAMRFVSYFSDLLPGKTLDYLKTFLTYVSENSSRVMLYFAGSVIIVTASAALRSMQTTVGLIQGERKRGIGFLAVSVVSAVAFVLMIYLGIVALFFGENLIAFINRQTTLLHLEYYWSNLRFALFTIILYVILVLVYLMCRGNKRGYGVALGAFVATVALVAVSLFFSLFITSSVKYPTLYNSLSGLIILMFWLYCCCVSVYVGAIINIVRGDIKKERARAQKKE